MQLLTRLPTTSSTSAAATTLRRRRREPIISRRTARRLASFAPLLTLLLVVSTLGSWGATLSWVGCLDGEACLAAHHRKMFVGAVIVGASLLARMAAAYFEELADAPDVDE